VGAVPSEQFYVRCRLTRGRPDAPPKLLGIFADAVLVEQRCQAETALRPGRDGTPPLPLRDLQLPEETEADINDAANDLAARGWGPAVAQWGKWPVVLRPLPGPVAGTPPGGTRKVRLVVLGVGTGAPGQQFDLPCPTAWPGADVPSPDDPGNPPPQQVLTDRLRVWTVEPPWGWDPRGPLPPDAPWCQRQWRLVPNLGLCGRTTHGFLFDGSLNRITFGDGEAGRVPPPGALVVADYGWTVADAGNLSAGLVWGRADDPAASGPRGPAPAPTVRFRNPLPAAGGRPAEELPQAMSRLAAVFNAPAQLLERGDHPPPVTLDGVDLDGQLPPPMAISLLDFECLARLVPGTAVARARAWAQTDPLLPGVRVPGVVTVVVVPSLPADRPEPTPGLLEKVAAHLEARRPIACRVCVVGPQYQPVRVQAAIHVAAGTGAAVLPQATAALTTFLHPLGGGPAGNGWPFGRPVHPGELLHVLSAVPGVRFVTGLQLAAGNGPWGETGIAVGQLALVEAAHLSLTVQEDA
jgi:hypothetical protein